MIDVYFVVVEKSLALDLVGPAESLRIANRVLETQGKLPEFRLHHVGFADTVRLSTGLHVSQLEPLPDQTTLTNPQHTAWIVILGQEGIGGLDPTTEQNAKLITWLRDLPIQKDYIEVITVCAGSLLLAYAGHLNHRQATTHHRDLAQLSNIAPTCHVMQDCIFTEDGAIASSAGVTTGIDLMVEKIAQTCGELVACEVAQWLVMSYRRSAKDTQHSPLLARRSHLHPAIHRAQEAISLNPTESWDLDKLASIAHTSPRNLTRLFKSHAEISPMNYVTQVRLNLAKTALDNGLSVTAVAAQVGFSSDMQLRRAWRKFGEAGTPSTYTQLK